MSFKIKPNRNKRRKVTEVEKAKAVNALRKMLGLSYDLPDDLEDALEVLARGIENWGGQGQRWKPGQIMFFEAGGGECHYGGFGWGPNLNDGPTLPNTPKLWGMIADDIENGNGESGLSLVMAMMGKDGRNRAQEYTQATPAELIPVLIILAYEDQGEGAGYIGLIRLPALSALSQAA